MTVSEDPGDELLRQPAVWLQRMIPSVVRSLRFRGYAQWPEETLLAAVSAAARGRYPAAVQYVEHIAARTNLDEVDEKSAAIAAHAALYFLAVRNSAIRILDQGGQPARVSVPPAAVAEQSPIPANAPTSVMRPDSAPAPSPQAGHGGNESPGAHDHFPPPMSVAPSGGSGFALPPLGTMAGADRDHGRTPPRAIAMIDSTVSALESIVASLSAVEHAALLKPGLGTTQSDILHALSQIGRDLAEQSTPEVIELRAKLTSRIRDYLVDVGHPPADPGASP